MNRFIRFGVFALVLSGALTTRGRAAVPPEADARIRQKIEDEMNAVLDQLIDRERYAGLYGLKYPVVQPAAGLDSVRKAANVHIEKLARQKYPDSRGNEQMRANAGKYRLWELGEDVAFTTLDGKTYNEKLREVKTFLIKVGPNEIRKEDLPVDVRVHVDPALAARVKAQDRTKLTRKLMATRMEYIREVRLTQEEEIFRREGYIKVAGQWQSEYAFFENRIAEERARYDRFLRPPLEYKHYYNAGYRVYNGEWYPPEDVDRLLAADQPEDDKKPAGPNPFAVIGRKIKSAFGAGGKKADADGDGAATDSESAAGDEADGGASDVLWGVVAVVGAIMVAAVLLGIIVSLANRKGKRR